VRDFLPRAAARRRAIAERLLATFEAWGYARIITPVFECADVLERGLGADARAAAIRFVEPGTGEVVALRPDITPQVARLAATRLADVGGPLRLCYEGAVNRLVAVGHGALAQREILQAGIELIGADGVDADAEAVALAATALARDRPDRRADRSRPRRLRDRGAGAVEPTTRDARRPPRRWRARTAARWRAPPRGCRPSSRPAWSRWSGCGARSTTCWPAPARWRGRRPRARRRWRWPTSRRGSRRWRRWRACRLDLGLGRGFEYYTGVRFAGFARGAADAVVRGGRYDELVGRYGRATGAVGFAVDIEAIAGAQRAIGVGAPEPGPACWWSGPTRRGVAAALRGLGVRAAPHLGAAPTPRTPSRPAGRTCSTSTVDRRCSPVATGAGRDPARGDRRRQDW
jgi:ATP phosphoribosyltransferase regulatory subunit